MRYRISPVVLVVIVIVVSCGCTQPVPRTGEIPGTPPSGTAVSALPPVATVATALPTTPAMPAAVPAMADPLVGSWRGYNYLATGKIQRDWTFHENGTWAMTNMKVKSRIKKVVTGTWKNTGAGSYQVIPASGAPDTFTYDRENDRFSDTYFGETYSRVSGDGAEEYRVPAMNLTVYGAECASAIGGSHPYPGKVYLVVNISVRNSNETPWAVIAPDSIWAIPAGGTGTWSMTGFSGESLENPFPEGKIVPGEEQTGQVVFGVPADSHAFTIRLIDGRGDIVSNSAEINNISSCLP